MNSKLIVVFVGEAEAGKDTFVDFVEKFFIRKRLRLAFATDVKGTCSLVSHLPLDRFYGDKKKYIPQFKKTIRELMQETADKLKEVYGEDVFVRGVIDEIECSEERIIFVTDGRHLVELNTMKDAGAVIVRIINPRITKMEHRSENEMDQFSRYDYVIKNDQGLWELEQEAREFCGTLEMLCREKGLKFNF